MDREEAVQRVGAALKVYETEPYGDLMLDANRAALIAVYALADPLPGCPGQFHGADGGACEICGWDAYASHEIEVT